MAGARRPEPLALATADTEAHVVVVGLARGDVQRRLATVEDPRSIESGPGGHVVVAHPTAGAVSLLTTRPARVRRVLRGLGAPRYTAFSPDGAHAFVSDGARGELVVVDLARGRIVAGVEVGAGARHLSLDPAGRTLWVALGSSAAAIAVVDVARSAAPAPAPSRAPAVPGPRRGLLPQRPARVGHRGARAPAGGAAGVRRGRPVLLSADDAPQHVSFGAASPTWPAATAPACGCTICCTDVYAGRARVPYGSYNIQAGAGAVVTPSLARGTLTILDRAGRVRREVQVAPAAHDACLLR